MTNEVLYDDKLAAEWAEWVETSNPGGSREKELFPELVSWLQETSASNVLDIGCGQGIISTLIPDELHYVGVDVSSPLVKRANSLYASTRKSFKVGDAYQLPLPTGSFDAAVSFWVWSHLNDPAKAADEMSRVLKPGGSYLVITANPATYGARRSFYSRYEEQDGKIVGDFDLGNGKKLTNTTLYLHSEQTFRNALTNAGLTISETKYLGMLDEYPGGLYVRFSGTKAP